MNLAQVRRLVDEAGRRARDLDHELAGRFVAVAGGGSAPLALVALGGYGRGRLAPGSDVDVMVVFAPGDEAAAERAAAAVLYPLWDRGLATGHAGRTVTDCEREVRADLRTLTALLDARPIAGDRGLAAAAGQTARRVAIEDPAGFVRALVASRAERAARAGILSRAQEPDLRDALGGLRDLDLAGWLSGVLPGLPPVPPSERAALEAAADLLWAARCALHGTTGGRSNRLAVDEQASVAEALGLRDVPGWEARDALVREVAAAGRRVALAVDRRLAAASASTSAAELAADLAAASRPWARLRGDRSLVEAAMLALAEGAESGAVLDDDAVERIEGAGRAAGRAAGGGGTGPGVAGPGGPAWSPAAVAAFVRMLAAGEGGTRALEAASALGLLPALLPAWRDLAGRPQRDPYHRFPVDAHLAAAAAEAARLLRSPGDPLVAEAVEAVGDAGPLLLGALLHDCGKVGRGSHVTAGPEVARGMLERMGVGGAERDDILFLVAEHLLLSETATRRDLADEDLVLRVAARVRDRRRLSMLYLLTLADAAATGPSAASAVRTALVRELVVRVGRALEAGRMDPGRAERLVRAEAALREALDAAGVPPDEARTFLDEAPASYKGWVVPAEALTHVRLVHPPPGPAEVRVAVRAPAGGTASLTIAARDRAGLLSLVAGALTVSGLSIVRARAFTTERGVALDHFAVRGQFEEEIGEARWERFRAALNDALAGRIDLAERVRALRVHSPRPRPGIPVSVRVDGGASDYHTVVEVGAPDRPGLLFDLARAFAAQAIDVHVANVATYGPRVVDVFYVSDAEGGKVADPDRLAALERALLEAAAP